MWVEESQGPYIRPKAETVNRKPDPIPDRKNLLHTTNMPDGDICDVARGKM